jgi:hypothetical protein
MMLDFVEAFSSGSQNRSESIYQAGMSQSTGTSTSLRLGKRRSSKTTSCTSGWLFEVQNLRPRLYNQKSQHSHLFLADRSSFWSLFLSQLSHQQASFRNNTSVFAREQRRFYDSTRVLRSQLLFPRRETLESVRLSLLATVSADLFDGLI